MKYYSEKIIMDYINTHKDKIKGVEVGMEEDWFWTAETIYDNVKGFSDVFDSFEQESDFIEVAGIKGSRWVTPVMHVTFTDGFVDVINCWVDDNHKEDNHKIAAMKQFALATGGMDSVYESM